MKTRKGTVPLRTAPFSQILRFARDDAGLSLAGGTEHILVLVLVHFNQCDAGRA